MYFINTDESVAHGAAIEGAVLSGADKVSDVVVIDVYPFTLWVEKADEQMEKNISCNSLIPAKIMQIYSTAYVDQSKVVMRVYERKETFSKEDNLLGIFRLHGLNANPKGLLHRIKVTFRIDTNSILSVSAENEGI